MKTSNKILLSALVLFIGSLLYYNHLLKSCYLKGEYHNRYNGFVPLSYKNFKSIRLNSATAINVMLVRGPFKVLAAPETMEFLRISQQGNNLTIDANFKYNYQGGRSDYLLYVSCPQLSDFHSDTRYIAGDNVVTDTLASEDFLWRPTVIRGFSGDSLNITTDHASNIVLEDNHFTKINAQVGVSKGSASDLTIGLGNQFTVNHFNILNKSRLWIKGKNEQSINYRLDDSARLILNGYIQNDYLKKINPIK